MVIFQCHVSFRGILRQQKTTSCRFSLGGCLSLFHCGKISCDASTPAELGLGVNWQMSSLDSTSLYRQFVASLSRGGLFQYLFKNLQKHKGFCGLNSSCLGNIFFCIKGVGTQSTQFGCAPECSFQEALRNQWVLRSLFFEDTFTNV